MIELREDALVNFFKTELKNLQFIPKTKYKEIERWLDILANKSEKWHKKTDSAKESSSGGDYHGEGEETY